MTDQLRQAEPPPEWESIKNILDEYGLDAIAFVTAWKAVQQRAEPVATVTSETGNPDITMSWWHEPALPVGTKLYTIPLQRQWVGLTNEDWNWIADKKGTSLDTFDQGVAWAAARLKERNNG